MTPARRTNRDYTNDCEGVTPSVAETLDHEIRSENPFMTSAYRSSGYGRPSATFSARSVATSNATSSTHSGVPWAVRCAEIVFAANGS